MPPHWVLEQQCGSSTSSESTDETTSTSVLKQAKTEGLDVTAESVTQAVSAVPAAPETANIETESPTATESSEEDKDEDSYVSNPDTLVKFNLVSEVHEVRGRHELSPQEYSNTWYQQSDFSRISSWNRMTVKLARQSQGIIPHEEEEQHCIRGLENRLKGRNTMRQTRKTNAIYSVLTEQANQKKFGYYPDREKIAEVYRGYTFDCVTDARQLGIQDERDSKEMLDSPRIRHQRRRGSFYTTFDDSDLHDLQHQHSFEERPVERPRQRAARRSSMPLSAPVPTEELHDEANAVTKTKKKKTLSNRITGYFKKKKGASVDRKSDSSKDIHDNLNRRNRYRRSSM